MMVRTPQETTPAKITPEILEFCKLLVPNGPNPEPIYVSVQEGDTALQSLCFQNVKGRIVKQGGTMCLGWTLWELPGLFLNAEYHACWQSPDGLVCITPREGREGRILFLPNGQTQWDGEQPPANQMFALCDWPEVHRFCSVQQRVFDYQARSRILQTPAGLEIMKKGCASASQALWSRWEREREREREQKKKKQKNKKKK